MKFGRILGLSFAALLVAGSAARAQDEDLGDLTTKKPAHKQQTVEEENNDPARSGVILGLGATAAVDNFHNVGASTDASGGFNVHVGYRHNKWLASDVEIEKYVQFDAHSGGTDVGEVNGWAMGLNERFYVLSGRFQPFAEVGINYLKMLTRNSANLADPRRTGDGPGLRFGAGLDVFATTKVVVSTDISYMLGVSDTKNFDMILFSLGFQFRP